MSFASLGQRQRVVINNKTSGLRDINTGVPDGSIFGPLFFLIFINDIVAEIRDVKTFIHVNKTKSEIKLFGRWHKSVSGQFSKLYIKA